MPDVVLSQHSAIPTNSNPSYPQGTLANVTMDPTTGALKVFGVNAISSTVTIADGADVAEGATTDAAVVGDNSGSISAKLRGISKILNSVWSSGSNWLQVSIQNATLAVTQSGTWNVGLNAGTNSIGTVVPAPKTILSVTGNVNSNTSIVTAVSSKRIKVVAVEFFTAYSAGTITPILTDGNGGTTIWTRLLQAISGSISGAVATIGGTYWLCATTAGNALYLNPNGQTVYYNISYFADDAT